MQLDVLQTELAQQLSEAQERVTELEVTQANQAAAVNKATTEMGAEIDNLHQRLADRSEQLMETTETLPVSHAES